MKERIIRKVGKNIKNYVIRKRKKRTKNGKKDSGGEKGDRSVGSNK